MSSEMYIIYFATDNYLRVCGKHRLSMTIAIITQVLNVVLDFILEKTDGCVLNKGKYSWLTIFQYCCQWDKRVFQQYRHIHHERCFDDIKEGFFAGSDMMERACITNAHPLLNCEHRYMESEQTLGQKGVKCTYKL